jgi:N-acylneuraminate cytidylyltransferase
MNIAVIPARGGSKRIPKKNIKDFCGKPMISYSIEAAKTSGLFNDIIVSTDNKEIRDIAEGYGAKALFVRPDNLADDYTTTVEVMAHAIQWLNDNQYEFDVTCCIYATAPFIQKEDLLKAYEIFKTNKWSYVFSATTFPFPVQRAIKRLDNGIEMFYPKYFTTRSQDIEESFHDAAQFYFGKPEAWIKKENIFQRNSEVIVLPRWRVQDIDTAEDWERAEKLFRTFYINV